jgi:hypothetical protein
VDDPAKRRFLYGVGLAWVPWVPALICLGYAAMGHISQWLILCGTGAMIASQVSAIFLLCRSFSRGQMSRSVVTALQIVLSVGTLVLAVPFMFDTIFLLGLNRK